MPTSAGLRWIMQADSLLKYKHLPLEKSMSSRIVVTLLLSVLIVSGCNRNRSQAAKPVGTHSQQVEAPAPLTSPSVMPNPNELPAQAQKVAPGTSNEVAAPSPKRTPTVAATPIQYKGRNGGGDAGAMTTSTGHPQSPQSVMQKRNSGSSILPPRMSSGDIRKSVKTK